jgi:hypothetical protein
LLKIDSRPFFSRNSEEFQKENIKFIERWGTFDHEVKIDIQFRPFSQCINVVSGTVTPVSLQNASLWVDYIYLDTDERRQFAQIAHEYLIEQLQHTGAESFSQTNVQQRLNFNHPCKLLVTCPQLVSNQAANRWTDFTDGTTPYAGNDFLGNLKLQLNGNDRFATRPASYFNLVQPYQHLPRGPAVGIYIYSFALKPTEHQPSGSVNMSRIDNATLQLTMASSAQFNLYTYMTNYNILRVMSGMAKIINKISHNSTYRNICLVLVNLKLFKFAILSNCEKPLRAKYTKELPKGNSGQDKELGYSNNYLDWAIRIQAPKIAMIRSRRRFNDFTLVDLRGLIIFYEGIRQSLFPKKIHRKMGYKRVSLILIRIKTNYSNTKNIIFIKIKNKIL